MNKETIVSRRGIAFLSYGNIAGAKVLHGFSLRMGGQSPVPYDTLNLGLHVADDRDTVLQNRRHFAEAVGYPQEAVVAGEQVHGTQVAVVTGGMKGCGHLHTADALPSTDGMVTAEPGIVLMAYSADCTILFFYDPVNSCVGVAHAGWRGAVADMAAIMVNVMVDMGCHRENIRTAFSPAIGQCCYRVGTEFADCVPKKYRQALKRNKDGEMFLNLQAIHRLSLTAEGVAEENIAGSRYCTCCRTDMFFSYRAAAGVTGRMAGVISLLK